MDTKDTTDNSINKEEKKSSLEENVSVYKWLKLAQSVILIALGIIFIITAYFSEGSTDKSLGYSVATVLSVYGLLDLFAGYLLYRSPFNQEVIFGAIIISLSVVFFVTPTLLYDILTPLLIGVMFTYSAMMIAYGVDKCIGKGTKKNVATAVLSFLGAALLIAGAVVYIVFNNKDPEVIQKWMTIIVGGVLIIIGLVSMVSLLIKIKNTKRVLKETEFKKSATPTTNDTNEVLNHDVKVVDISELKKTRGKKIHNKQIADSKYEIQKSDDDSSSSDDLDGSDDGGNDKPESN